MDHIRPYEAVNRIIQIHDTSEFINYTPKKGL
ncbi:hypothetical protein ATF84_11576 [[Clostridium] innocuum]|nr:hypothetical protein ATF84_11576 [[Clostridium] innocuum]SSA47636.1 hypothetical protein SAMN04487929_11576 [[Clostridium] innocuum]